MLLKYLFSHPVSPTRLAFPKGRAKRFGPRFGRAQWSQIAQCKKSLKKMSGITKTLLKRVEHYCRCPSCIRTEVRFHSRWSSRLAAPRQRQILSLKKKEEGALQIARLSLRQILAFWVFEPFIRCVRLRSLQDSVSSSKTTSKREEQEI